MATEPKHYTALSNAELRNRQLEIDDPHDQANLTNHIPEGVSPVRILNVYRFNKWPSEKAYCSKCEARRHRDGFTVELDDGTAAILGSKCGADLWGESWHDVAAQFELERERAGTIASFNRILPELKLVIVAFEKWRPMVRIVAKHQRQFQSTMPETFSSLCTAATRADRTLIVHQKVRDFLAEGAFERRYGKSPDSPIFTMLERSLHQLHGCAFFEHRNIEVLLDLALQDLDAAITVGMNSALHSQRKLSMHRAKLRDALERLERVGSAVRGLQQFYKSDNLLHVARWIELNSTLGEKYEVRDNTLIDLRTRLKMKPPPDFSMVDLEPVRRLRKIS